MTSSTIQPATLPEPQDGAADVFEERDRARLSHLFPLDLPERPTGATPDTWRGYTEQPTNDHN